MTKEFLRAYNLSIKGHEGGWVNDPDDPGGETYCGISRVFHPQWEGWGFIDRLKERQRINTGDIFPAIEERVAKFYNSVYWNQNRCQMMIGELGLTFFDMAVNHGSGKATELLQRALNAANRNQKLWNDIEVDGIMGNQTSGAVAHAVANRKDKQVNTWLNCLRGAFYVEIMESDNTQEKYATAWEKRIRIERLK